MNGCEQPQHAASWSAGLACSSPYVLDAREVDTLHTNVRLARRTALKGAGVFEARRDRVDRRVNKAVTLACYTDTP
jgi:hypothetical protein